MTVIKKEVVSSTTYNSLPHIHDVSHVPQIHSTDLEDLRSLLVKHNVPSIVSIRLIHKHFNVNEGEVMSFENVMVPSKGSVQAMRPVELAEASHLRPIHYFVDENASLQSYEYADCEAVDMSNFQTFLAEFCQVVAERGLQHKFGLKVNPESDAGWIEFEFAEKRSTILIPDGMPKPEGEYSVSVSTEWGGNDDYNGTHGRRTRSCRHCYHCNSHPPDSDTNCSGSADDTNGGAFYLGGQKILPESPVYAIISAVTAVF